MWTTKYNTAKLAEKSAARVAKNPILSKIAGATAILKQRRKDTTVPLMRTAWEKRRADQKAALDATSPDLKHTPPKLTVKPLEDSPAPATAPGPGGRTDDRAVKWRDSLARDPWVEESVMILGDMVGK